MRSKDPAEKVVRDIRRKTRRKHSTEEQIRIAHEGLRGEESFAESLYYSWSKELLEAGNKRLAGDPARQATSNEVKALRAEARDLKEALVDAYFGRYTAIIERKAKIIKTHYPETTPVPSTTRGLTSTFDETDHPTQNPLKRPKSFDDWQKMPIYL